MCFNMLYERVYKNDIKIKTFNLTPIVNYNRSIFVYMDFFIIYMRFAHLKINVILDNYF